MTDQEPENGAEDAAGRALATSREWEERWPGPMSVRTSQGDVILEDVAYRWDPASGVAYLEVTVGGPVEDPHFRVVNPPLLVEDPEGDVELRGRRWREDPLAALAELIGRNGGAATVRRNRRMR